MDESPRAQDKKLAVNNYWGDTVLRNSETGKDEAFQVVIPNLKFSSNLTLGFSADGDPSTTSFECEIMKPANSTAMIKKFLYILNAKYKNWSSILEL